MAIPEVSVLPSFHDQLSAGLRSIGRNPRSTQASEMVLRETRIDNVKCLLTAFNPFADEGQQYTVLLIRRMEEGTNVALSTKRRVGKMDRLFGSRHRIYLTKFPPGTRLDDQIVSSEMLERHLSFPTNEHSTALVVQTDTPRPGCIT